MNESGGVIYSKDDDAESIASYCVVGDDSYAESDYGAAGDEIGDVAVSASDVANSDVAADDVWVRTGEGGYEAGGSVYGSSAGRRCIYESGAKVGFCYDREIFCAGRVARDLVRSFKAVGGGAGLFVGLRECSWSGGAVDAREE